MTDPTTAALAEDIALSLGTDYFLMREQLSGDEAALLDKVRAFGELEILPVVNDYWERGEFPFELVAKLRDLKIVGDGMRGYGTVPMTAVGQGLVSYALGRLDGSIGTFLGVHVGLAMKSVYLLGTREQRERWLPSMARLETIGAFALTEPEHGSDAVALETTARRDGESWVINGRKRWPGNAVWCAVIVVFARGPGHLRGHRGDPGPDRRPGRDRNRRVQIASSRTTSAWARSAVTPVSVSTWAARPVPCSISPRSRCPVPIRSCPSSRLARAVSSRVFFPSWAKGMCPSRWVVAGASRAVMAAWRSVTPTPLASMAFAPMSLSSWQIPSRMCSVLMRGCP